MTEHDNSPHPIRERDEQECYRRERWPTISPVWPMVAVAIFLAGLIVQALHRGGHL